MLHIRHIGSPPVIASQMYFSRMLPFFFLLPPPAIKCREEKKWVHYPATLHTSVLQLTGILGRDATVVHFHLSPFISHYVSTSGVKKLQVWTAALLEQKKTPRNESQFQDKMEVNQL